MTSAKSAARKRRFKNDVYAAVARVPGALANPHRLELLDLVSQRPRTVQDVAAEAHLTVANASQHFQVLARAGLVEVERRGAFALYRAAGPPVYRLLCEMRRVAEISQAEIAQAERGYFDRGVNEVTTFGDARSAIRRPGTALLDVRPREEYEVAHIPGATNVPLEELKAGTVRLPASRRYVVYCRGPYCVFADEAVTLLRGQGFDVTRLALGPVEWIAAGGRVRRVG